MQFTKFMGRGSQTSPALNYEAPELSIFEVAIEKGFALSTDATLGKWGESDEEIYW